MRQSESSDKKGLGPLSTWVIWVVSGICFVLFIREYTLEHFRLTGNVLPPLGMSVVLFVLPKLSEFEFLGIKGKFQEIKDEVVREVKLDRAERDFAKVAEQSPPQLPKAGPPPQTPEQEKAADELRQFALSFPSRFLNFLAFLCETKRPLSAGEISSEANLSGIDPDVFGKLFEYGLSTKLIEREAQGYTATALTRELISATKFFYRKPRRNVFSSDENWQWELFERKWD